MGIVGINQIGGCGVCKRFNQNRSAIQKFTEEMTPPKSSDSRGKCSGNGRNNSSN